jgi:uncharacterized protein (DUF1501 family)
MSSQENSRLPRRDFLALGAGASAAAALGVFAPRVRAISSRPQKFGISERQLGGKSVVVVFLRGGADALSIAAPVYDAHYKNVLRPSLRVGEPGEGTALDGLPLDATFAMHPTMSALHGMWNALPGGLAMVHAVGYPGHSRSHFESQDVYERGLAMNDPLAQGWVSRYAQVTSQGSADALVRTLGVGSLSLPRALAGDASGLALQVIEDLSIDLSTPVLRGVLQEAFSAPRRLRRGSAAERLGQGGEGVFGLSDHFGAIDPTSYVPGATYPTGKLGDSLEETAMILKAGLDIELAWIDTGGWDHHANLPGVFPSRATELSDALAAFAQDMGSLLSDTVVVVMSEFGREAKENGSLGTDHGKGGLMMLFGGAVQGGQIHGVWPGVGAADLESGRFLADANDYRDVLGDVLVGHLGVPVGDLAGIFPGHSYAPVGII